MQDDIDRSLREHQLIIQDDKQCRTYPLLYATYEIGRFFKLPIRLSTRSPQVAPHHATLVPVGQHEAFHYQLIAAFPQDEANQYRLLVNGNPVQTCELHDGDTIEFAPGVSAIYRSICPVELPSPFPEGLLDFRAYGLGLEGEPGA